jgi:hypothetical protein
VASVVQGHATTGLEAGHAGLSACRPRHLPARRGGGRALDRWLSWGRRSQLPSFVYLAKRITKHREAIEANLEHGLSQGLIESTNTKIRLLTRIAFGFHGPQPLIALALLALGSPPTPRPKLTHTSSRRAGFVAPTRVSTTVKRGYRRGTRRSSLPDFVNAAKVLSADFAPLDRIVRQAS